METILKHSNKNTQLSLSWSGLSHSKKYCLPWKLTLLVPIYIILSIYMLLSYYILHDSCTPYYQISSPLNPNLIFPCMFINHLHEHLHPPQCIMSRIITLLCMYMSDMIIINNQNEGILSLLFPINILSISYLHVIFGDCNNVESICSCPPWYPTSIFLLFLISDTFSWFLLSIIIIIYWLYHYQKYQHIILNHNSHVFHWIHNHHYY